MSRGYLIENWNGFLITNFWHDKVAICRLINVVPVNKINDDTIVYVALINKYCKFNAILIKDISSISKFDYYFIK